MTRAEFDREAQLRAPSGNESVCLGKRQTGKQSEIESC